MIRALPALLCLSIFGCAAMPLPEPPQSPAEVARLAVAASKRADKAALVACMAYAADTARRDPATDEACGLVPAPTPDAGAAAGAAGQ